MLTAFPHHIIAIGASAGGMQEINSFFDHTPLDGVAYVIIQHLSADFKSRMVELLARHSKLEVKEAENGMEVKNNKVYLIPNDKFMTINKGRLLLIDKENLKGPHLTINAFFDSLAAEIGEKAIGVVLSGLGSDGTEGVKAIKKVGGMVLARNPETTEFASMPSNAIATGLIDFVLEPELMPAAIEEYVNHANDQKEELENDEKILVQIIELIKEKSPLDFTDYKQTTILRRTKRRAADLNFKMLADYLSFLKVETDELDSLAKDFLISVTAFFRDEKAFDRIREKVLPDIISKLAEGEELKVWVAGCATGEEAYSIAILIAEQLKDNFQNTIVKIFATDIDTAALAHAGRALYAPSVTKNISAERLERFFLKEGGQYRVKPDIRKMVIFAQHDLVKNPPYCNMHLISCRNLLIYMAPILQKKIFTMLLFGLKMDGFLFLGSSENPMPIINSLEVVDKKWKIYRNIKAKRSVNFDAFSMPEIQQGKRMADQSFHDDGIRDANHTMAEAMLTGLVTELDNLSVCIDENFNVLKSYGDATKFLLQKYFTSNLSDLLPKPLAIAFNAVCKSVLKTRDNESAKGIRIKNGSSQIVVDMTVRLLPSSKNEQPLLLVTFTEDKQSVHKLLEDGLLYDEKIYLDQYTVNLEEELKDMKEKLHLSYQRLNASNENMQSFNEELISANEEMQSTNEEMQSVNEELHTINADYQLKNKELIEINDDLNNYFRSNINGQLFIDNEMRLMKFSPSATKQINLLETDIGRPLSNITTNIKFETILDDIKKVLNDGSIITKEIETNNGKWYQIMTMPYVQQSDHKNTGAIITFNDITELKTVQQELDKSNKLMNMAIAASGIATWSMNTQKKEFEPSARLKEMFGFDAEETMTYEQAIGQIVTEYQPLVVAAVENSMINGDKYDIEYPINGFHNDKLRWVRGVGNLSKSTDGKPNYFTGVLNDITIHKHDELRKNDFIAMVSHELRTPLTLLQAHIQMIEAKAKKAHDNPNILSLEKALVQVKKMNLMVNGFLNVSSFGAGKIYLNLQVFQIDALLDEIVEEMTLITSSHTITLRDCPKLSIKADREKIGQVINNFLSNAIKYSSTGKNIDVLCKELNGSVEISIKDEGVGIKPEDQKKLFSRYHRIENAHTQKISGFGLGLYLSAEIIQRHNGKVWVESEIGKGSTFYFSLPLIE